MDIKDIKETINLIDLAERLGIEVRRNNKTQAIRCPNHMKELGKEDNHLGNCLAGNKSYWCFACNSGGDIFTLVMNVCDCSFPEAIKIIENMYGVSVSSNFNPEEAQPLNASELELLGLNKSSMQKLYTYSRQKYYDVVRQELSKKETCVKNCLENYCRPGGKGAGLCFNIAEVNKVLPTDFYPLLCNQFQKIEVKIQSIREKVTF